MTLPPGFRIQKLTIEGYKGFTHRQEIDLQGRHAFCLGSNGHGKSSLLEAIRWGLFGSRRRPNEVVAHRRYSGPCRVEITLMRGGKPWVLKRTLIRGQSGGSDATLFDERGREQRIRDVMPQIDSQDAGEGMHIVFAPQSMQVDRQPDDLKPFERTILNYLGLTDPQSLLSQLESFLTHQEEVENELGREITASCNDIHSKISQLERQRGALLKTAPWAASRLPTRLDTEGKVRELIEELVDSAVSDGLLGLSLDALIVRARTSFQSRRNEDPKGLRVRFGQLDAIEKQLLRYFEVQERIAVEASKLKDIQLRLAAVLDDETLDNLNTKVVEARYSVELISLERKIVSDITVLIDRDLADRHQCPVCATVTTKPELTGQLRRRIVELDTDTSADSLESLQNRLDTAERLLKEEQRASDALAQLHSKAATICAGISDAEASELNSSSSISEVQSVSTRISNKRAAIGKQLSDHETWISGIEARLRTLSEENRFHTIQKSLRELDDVNNQLKGVQQEYEQFVDFGESVRAIHTAVELEFVDLLKSELPALSESLTNTFAALTEHSWYDRLLIDEGKLPRLELQVASSKDETNVPEPTAVLNGQAEAALRLVPYFVFGQSARSLNEVYLVMLDDPTRAFDQEHIRILTERLAELSGHVQLIVASQESDRLRKLVPQSFAPSSFVVIECEQWSFDNGPELRFDYE